ESKRLQSIYEDTIEGKSRQVFITGSPGMGKTQTLVRFREWLSSKDALVLMGKFLDYGAKTTDALKLFKTLLSGHIPTGVLKSIAAVSASWTDENLLEESEDASTEKWQAFEQLMTSFISIAKVRPVVIMLDDLQWAEALSLEFLGFLLRNTEHLPFFFIGTARAEEAETKGNPFREWLVGQSRYLHYEKIVLQPFNKDKINQLLQSIFQFIEVSQKDIEVLFDLTGGNPFYLTEVIRLLLDNKKIFFQENVWHGSEFDQINLPDTISNVIRYKLETCPEELRSLLSTASVLGDDFSFQLLEEVTDLSEIDLEKLLATAVKLKLLCEDKEETDDHYRFYNTTIRKVIYDDISKRQKKRIHGRVAEALLKTSKGKTRSIDNALAYHYFMSADWEKAYQYSTEALKHAIRKQSIDEVLRLSGYAEEALTNLVEESGETLDKPGERQKIIGQLKIRRATAIMRLGRFEEASREAEEMKEFIDALGDKTLQAKRALVQLELCYWSNRHAEGVLIGTEGVKLAKAAGDDECTRYILYHLAWCQARISKIDTAIQIFKEVERASEEAKDLTLQARALCGLGQLVHYSGEWRQARIYMEKGRECAIAIGDRFAEAQVLMHYSWILTYENNSELLLKLADEAVKIDRTCDWRNWEAYNYFVIGRHYVHNLVPNLELAEEYLSRSLSIFKETNDQGGQLIVSPELVQMEFLTNPSNEVLD
ncbi:MAG: AAA family ATPase, partial [Blastocatellia bacterium]|nr:AAA family ATPase [Blastocatellia bacterium]